jgi:hypothetical protein
VSATNLVDILEAQGITWKAYMEAYTPGPGGDCNPAGTIGTYYRKHNPFMTYDNIRNNKTRCQKIVPSQQLDIDVQNNALPQFFYYTPDINNVSGPP